MKATIKKALPILFWLAVWEIVALVINKSVILVTPLVTLKQIVVLASDGTLFKVVGYTFIRIALGFFIAYVLAMIFAVLSYISPLAKSLISPIISTMKSIPVASFVILVLFWMSSKYLSIFIAIITVLPIIYTNVLEGLYSTDKKLLEMADIFHVKKIHKARYIYLPSIMPYLNSAVKTAVGFCVKSSIAAELIGQPNGSIGDLLYRAKIYLETEDLFAWTVTVIAVGKLFEIILIKVTNVIYNKTQKVKGSKRK